MSASKRCDFWRQASTHATGRPASLPRLPPSPDAGGTRRGRRCGDCSATGWFTWTQRVSTPARTDNWRWKLSSAGKQAAAGGPWEPRDPEGYLRRLRTEVPDLDSLAMRYVEEALRAFNARSYLATSVMLGVASEQVFLGLAAAYVQASGTVAAKLGQLLISPRASYFVRFTEFRRLVEHQRGDLPADLSDVLTLDAVADLLRVTRNAAGHPSDQLVDEDTARTHLHMAGRYLRKMTALRQHFAQRPEHVETP